MSSYDKSLARCIAYAAPLPCTDDRFLQEVEVLHMDGSFFYLRGAFTMNDPENEEWLWVITEHFGEFVFDREDLDAFVARRMTGPAREFGR